MEREPPLQKDETHDSRHSVVRIEMNRICPDPAEHARVGTDNRKQSRRSKTVYNRPPQPGNFNNQQA